MEAAAISVVENGASAGVSTVLLAREIDPANGLDFLTIRLSSGRKLYYAHPSLGLNQWGNPSIIYMGMDQTTKKWKQVETYGGKLVENVVQAIAAIMSQPMAWAPDLPLGADGWVGDFYKKD